MLFTIKYIPNSSKEFTFFKYNSPFLTYSNSHCEVLDNSMYFIYCKVIHIKLKCRSKPNKFSVRKKHGKIKFQKLRICALISWTEFPQKNGFHVIHKKQICAKRFIFQNEWNLIGTIYKLFLVLLSAHSGKLTFR